MSVGGKKKNVEGRMYVFSVVTWVIAYGTPRHTHDAFSFPI